MSWNWSITARALSHEGERAGEAPEIKIAKPAGSRLAIHPPQKATLPRALDLDLHNVARLADRSRLESVLARETHRINMTTR